MRFQIGERARIARKPLNWEVAHLHGQECRITGTVPPNEVVCDCGSATHYWVDIAPRVHGCENYLQKLLPDSDTYHRADISIDDLMKSVRTREVA